MQSKLTLVINTKKGTIIMVTAFQGAAWLPLDRALGPGPDVSKEQVSLTPVLLEDHEIKKRSGGAACSGTHSWFCC